MWKHTHDCEHLLKLPGKVPVVKSVGLCMFTHLHYVHMEGTVLGVWTM